MQADVNMVQADKKAAGKTAGRQKGDLYPVASRLQIPG